VGNEVSLTTIGLFLAAARGEAAALVRAKLVADAVACERLEVSEIPVRRGHLWDMGRNRVQFPDGEAYEVCYVALVDPCVDAQWAHPAHWAFVPAAGRGEVVLQPTEFRSTPPARCGWSSCRCRATPRRILGRGGVSGILQRRLVDGTAGGGERRRSGERPMPGAAQVIRCARSWIPRQGLGRAGLARAARSRLRDVVACWHRGAPCSGWAAWQLTGDGGVAHSSALARVAKSCPSVESGR
jgi:hypothetical protein